MRWIQFGRVILLSDAGKCSQAKLTDIEIVHRVQPGSKLDYEHDVLTETVKHCHTTHLLHMEWDSAVMNPLAWNQRWMDYDFIGAPWPDHHDAGWPKCGSHNNVGNNGFSLKSKRFCELVAKSVEHFKDDPSMVRQMDSCDRYASRTIRPWLEENGVVFASADEAWKFSCESRVYAGEFGAHGKYTFELNNWGHWFKTIKGSDQMKGIR